MRRERNNTNEASKKIKAAMNSNIFKAIALMPLEDLINANNEVNANRLKALFPDYEDMTVEMAVHLQHFTNVLLDPINFGKNFVNITEQLYGKPKDQEVDMPVIKIEEMSDPLDNIKNLPFEILEAMYMNKKKEKDPLFLKE